MIALTLGEETPLVETVFKDADFPSYALRIGAPTSRACLPEILTVLLDKNPLHFPEGFL